MKQNSVEKLGSQLILDYMSKHKLPEVDLEKVKDLPHEGWAIEYKKSGLVHEKSETGINGLMVTPDDPPVAVSYLGTGEDPHDLEERE